MQNPFQTEQGSCCEVQLRGAIAGATFLSRRIAVVLLRPRDTDMHLIALCRITTRLLIKVITSCVPATLAPYNFLSRRLLRGAIAGRNCGVKYPSLLHPARAKCSKMQQNFLSRRLLHPAIAPRNCGVQASSGQGLSVNPGFTVLLHVNLSCVDGNVAAVFDQELRAQFLLSEGCGAPYCSSTVKFQYNFHCLRIVNSHESGLIRTV